MMGLGQDIVKGIGTGREVATKEIPEELKRFVRDSAHLDSILSSWEVSDGFGVALEHAERGTELMNLMKNQNEIYQFSSRDSPFIGYCYCQIVKDLIIQGLVNLIAVRQLALLKMRNPDSNADQFCQSYRQKAQVVMNLLESHSKSFSASGTGKGLLESIIAEIGGGQYAMKVLQVAQNSTNPYIKAQKISDRMVQTIIKQGMGKTTGDILNEPGKCAGTSMQPEGLSDRPKVKIFNGN
jgi:hypothetical protein